MTIGDFNLLLDEKTKHGWNKNETKTKSQVIGLNHWFRNGAWGILEAYTGWGKTVAARSAIRRLRTKVPNAVITIVVPSIKLHEQWKRELRDIPNLNFYVLMTFVTSNDPGIVRECDLLIIDEVHHIADENTKHYSRCLQIVKTRFCLGLTGTLTEEQRKFLKSQGLVTVFTISIIEGRKLGIVDPYKIINYGITLTPDEQQAYAYWDTMYNKKMGIFTDVDPNNGYELANACLLGAGKRTGIVPTKTIKLTGKKNPVTMTGKEWREYCSQETDREPDELMDDAVWLWKAVSKRNEVMREAIGRKQAVRDIIGEFMDQKIILFAKRQEGLEDMMRKRGQFPSGAVIYHSKLKKAEKKLNLDLFESKDYNVMLTCGSLDEGYDFAKIKVGINFEYDSIPRQWLQRFGRTNRLDEDDPDQVCVFISIYCNSFTSGTSRFDAKKVVCQDYIRLRAAQKGLVGIEWATNLGDLQKILAA